MKTRSWLALAIIFSVLTATVEAQEIDLEKHPGYINLEEIEIPDNAGKVTDINLGPALLKLAQWAENEEDDLTKSLSGILSIRIKSFEIRFRDTEKIRSVIDKIEKKIKSENWMNLIQVKDRDAYTNVSMKLDGEKSVGLLLMSLEPGDVVTFANIVGGDIDLKRIADFGLGLSGSARDSLHRAFRKY